MESHVLIVDDEELYRRALERILTRVGYSVSVARDASEALLLASQQPFDLVLSDVQMPGINGIELVRQLHELDPDLPCIVITGYGSPSVGRTLRAGAFWYLEKPFDQSHLTSSNASSNRRSNTVACAPRTGCCRTSSAPDTSSRTSSVWRGAARAGHDRRRRHRQHRAGDGRKQQD